MSARIEIAIKLIEALSKQIAEMADTINDQSRLNNRMESLIDEMDNRL